MRKAIQIAGGMIIAAAVVIGVVTVYRNIVLPGLKTGGIKETNAYSGGDTNAMKEAVSFHPVFTYTGAEPVLAGNAYGVFDDVQVTDAKDDYDKTMTEALEEERIKVPKVTILTEEKAETADASFDESTKQITFAKSGVYCVKVTGKDRHNNKAEAEFFVPVESKWEEDEAE